MFYLLWNVVNTVSISTHSFCWFLLGCMEFLHPTSPLVRKKWLNFWYQNDDDAVDRMSYTCNYSTSTKLIIMLIFTSIRNYDQRIFSPSWRSEVIARHLFSHRAMYWPMTVLVRSLSPVHDHYEPIMANDSACSISLTCSWSFWTNHGFCYSVNCLMTK